jgi:hypothetical protein
MLEEIAAGPTRPMAARRDFCAKATWSQETIASVGECIGRADCAARAACLARLTVEGVFLEVGLSTKGKARH